METLIELLLRELRDTFESCENSIDVYEKKAKALILKSDISARRKKEVNKLLDVVLSCAKILEVMMMPKKGDIEVIELKYENNRHKKIIVAEMIRLALQDDMIFNVE